MTTIVTPTRRRFQFGIASLLLLIFAIALWTRVAFNFGVVELTFLDLKFESTSRIVAGTSVMPASIKRLHNRQVRIQGYIYPTSDMREKGIKNFILSRDNNEPPSAMDDSEFAVVRIMGDSGIDFTTKPVAVRGTLTILPTPLTNGQRRFFYEIAASKVEQRY